MSAMYQCAIFGCTNLRHAKGLCRKHYDRQARGNDPAATPLDQWRNPLVCTCDVPLLIKGRGYGQCFRCFRHPPKATA